jgi:fructose-1-phosphate kinase PfkB-like protein
MGARNVIVTHDLGVFAHLRREKERGRPMRFRVEAPVVDVVSPVGAGSVLLAAFLAARLEKLSPEDALRRAVAAGTASTTVVGSGQFEPREATRLVGEVTVAELASVPAEH